MKTFKPGARIRVKRDATIVGLADKANPYWYVVRFPDGHEETVNIARINYLSDEIRASIDHDASVQIISNRLSARGARELLLWLQTHEQDFIDQVEQEQAVVLPDEKFVTQSVEDIIIKRARPE